DLVGLDLLDVRGGAVGPEHVDRVDHRLRAQAEVLAEVVLRYVAGPALDDALHGELAGPGRDHGPDGARVLGLAGELHGQPVAALRQLVVQELRPAVEVVDDHDGGPQLLHNELAQSGNWLTVKLTGKPKNTSAIGAVITARAGKLTMKRIVQSGTSYISQDDFRQHFGLGAETMVDSVDVLWADGTTSHVEKIKANQI